MLSNILKFPIEFIDQSNKSSKRIIKASLRDNLRSKKELDIYLMNDEGGEIK